MQQSLLLAFASLFSLVRADVFSLSSLDWTLKNANGSIVIPATVPSQVHLDLMRAGIITEPLLGINDFTQRWIAADNWTYTASLAPFTSQITISETDRTLLVFYGLDTVANITLSGQTIDWVNNQFRQYVYDVTDFIVPTNQESGNITISFESAFTYGRNVTSRPDVENTLVVNFEYPGVRQNIRKIQSDFGWDWGPAFVPSGIFKPAYLITLSESSDSTTQTVEPASHPLLVSETGGIFIEEHSLEIHKLGQNFSTAPDEGADWIVNVTLAVRSIQAGASPIITVSIPELQVSSGALAVASIPASTSNATFVTAKFNIPDNVPERWYPHNLGTPKLYNFTITLALSSDPTAPAASFNLTGGFRTVQLVQTAYPQEEVDARGITPGDQWHFNVNGKAFYALGTNIIPFDPFYARVTSDQVRWIIESAVRSGQNMLRVWGGGIYQPSDELTGGYDFYSVCDELGILAWSELIFSDALYPINDFLLDNIEPEVRQNVRRINKHVSNAEWAGGNEIEEIELVVRAIFPNGQHYFDEFQTLFGEFLFDIVTSEQSSVAYTDCSTTKGVLSLDPYELRYLNFTLGDIYGNSEHYDYDATSAFDYLTYPVSRFVNEFGFHSMPSFYSWEEVLESPDDFAFNSTVVVSRDHHPPAGSLAWPNPNAGQGQAQMSDAVMLWLPTPGTSDSNQTFTQWCWSTQLFQSLYMVSEIAWYRRGAGQPENNLGALVWQLNDVWQGVSWSSIEYSGRWKVLNYGIANIYTPVVIYPFWKPDLAILDIMVTSDRWYTINGTAYLTWFNWNGTLIENSSSNFSVPSLNNSLIYHGEGLSSILPKGQDVKDVFMLLNLTANTEDGIVTHEQYFTPTSLAGANLVDPQITLSHQGDLTFTVSAKGGVGVWTWLDHPAGTVGYFEDTSSGILTNGFFLIPGIDRSIKFVQNVARSRVTQPDPADFVVRSVWNNTHI